MNAAPLAAIGLMRERAGFLPNTLALGYAVAGYRAEGYIGAHGVSFLTVV